MKIAIIASNTGEKAIYIHDFFKEGNRIEVDCLLTENPDSPVSRKMREEGVEVIYMTPGQQMAELSDLLKSRDVELLVVDDLEGDVPEELKQLFGEAIVYPTHRESGPLEIIETTNRLKAAANAAMETPAPKKENLSDEPKSLEQEWADALDVELENRSENEANKEGEKENGEEPAKKEEPEVVPPVYQQQPPVYNRGPVFNQGPTAPYYGRGNGYPRQEMPRQAVGQTGSEPMPDTYLVWSVLATILCCLIPGIVAIIYSASVSSKYYAGDIEGSKRASRNAQIWCIVSIIAGVIWGTLYLPLALFLS